MTSIRFSQEKRNTNFNLRPWRTVGQWEPEVRQNPIWRVKKFQSFLHAYERKYIGQ